MYSDVCVPLRCCWYDIQKTCGMLRIMGISCRSFRSISIERVHVYVFKICYKIT